ncbi:unnamed protein product [Durusdinium trenchii]|uniref:Uncharacterized protein n=1 Tax=Durusdinium trenchii TaxID=1381693 RepID=A0ABP0Q5T4_9DINO
MFWDAFGCFSTTWTTIQEDIFTLWPSTDTVSCWNCGCLAKHEWAGYNPAEDRYDVHRAVVHGQPPQMTSERLLKKQILALSVRIARGGDPATVRHYQTVMEELKEELFKLENPTVIISRGSCVSKHSREESILTELRTMSTGLSEDAADFHHLTDSEGDISSESHESGSIVQAVQL